jgi:hypothetical protein
MKAILMLNLKNWIYVKKLMTLKSILDNTRYNLWCTYMDPKICIIYTLTHTYQDLNNIFFGGHFK